MYPWIKGILAGAHSKIVSTSSNTASSNYTATLMSICLLASCPLYIVSHKTILKISKPVNCTIEANRKDRVLSV